MPGKADSETPVASVDNYICGYMHIAEINKIPGESTMSLIICSECGNAVSDQASACPKCGIPLSKIKKRNRMTSTATTTEETAKRFKLQKILSLSLIVIGGIFWLNDLLNSSNIKETFIVADFILLIGMSWYFINRLRIWWFHK